MTSLAREYGEGLFELAREEGLVDEIHEEMNMLGALLREENDYVRLMQSRAMSLSERKSALDAAFRGRVHAYTLNLMKLLLERGAFYALPQCADYFHRRFLEVNGIAEATVTTAQPLTDTRRRELAKKLSDMSGKTVWLIERVDPGVMGGLRVDIEGKRYDNTIRHRLDSMRRRLTEEG